MARDLLADTDLRFVWRHLPLTDVHPAAQLAAEAAEAAAAQGKFWEMHDLLLDTSGETSHRPTSSSTPPTWTSTSTASATTSCATSTRGEVAQDVESADVSGATGTPTFFVNGQRHYGAYDLDSLVAAVTTARAQLQRPRGNAPRISD